MGLISSNNVSVERFYIVEADSVELILLQSLNIFQVFWLMFD